MEINKNLIESFAPAPSAVSNGKALSAAGKYTALSRTQDGLLYFGNCKGSGNSVYHCSVDFSGDAPVGRCSCPSRQFPCKHCIGLLFEALSEKEFSIAEIPEDILSKRKKSENRVEKKAEKLQSKPSAPSKSRIRAQQKKVEAQLAGIKIANQMLKNIASAGLGAIDIRLKRAFEEQINDLGNYYIPGVQAAFNSLLLSLNSESSDSRFISAIEKTTCLYSLLKQGGEYLERKIENLKPDVASNIEELLGHAWKLDELRENGCCITDAALVQLCFSCYDDSASAQFVDEGLWICLSDGKIYKTRNYRPYRANMHIKTEDSVFGLLKTPELFIYPGGLNPRVRWERCEFFSSDKDLYSKINSFAGKDFPAIIKAVKNQLKNPLGDKNPVVLAHFSDFGTITAADGTKTPVIRDRAGAQIILGETSYGGRGTLGLFESALNGGENYSALLIFENDLSSDLLFAKPLCIVTEKTIIRLLY